MNQTIESTSIDIAALTERIKKASEFTTLLKSELRNVVIGQEHMVESLLLGLLSNGHILLEGVPGLAKTLAIKSLASTVKVGFSRIQFTPDLLPGDVLGTQIYNPANQSFNIKKGPIFSNFILADEINRAPAKVQSALLEAMQERQITIGEETFNLPEPFLVLATMNPIEQEGTYPLPEAQVDRFMFKVIVDYPTKSDELEIMRLNLRDMMPKLKAIVDPKQILEARSIVKEIYLDEKVENYILDIVRATRNPEEYGLGKFTNLIEFGASPRATIYLALATKAYAFLRHRGFVVPDDVRNICYDVLRHRIGVTYEAEAENITSDNIISEILSTIEVP